jgi:SDR family mycofactocin-dependent oxidoreductase
VASLVTRVAVVTGAARGIGAATVRVLCSEGWSVLAVDAGTDDPVLPYALGTLGELDALAAETGARPYLADVRDLNALAAAVADAESWAGGVDALIGCAGVIAGGAAQPDVSVEQERAVLDVNLGGVLNLARVGLPALLRRPEPRAGRFVAVASSAATRGLPNLAAYCAAKAGVTGLVRALAAELARTGITANAVSPGSTDTAVLAESARLYGLSHVEEFSTHQAIGRLLQPAEIAAAIAYLTSPSGAAVTGANLTVDGGFAL